MSATMWTTIAGQIEPVLWVDPAEHEAEQHGEGHEGGHRSLVDDGEMGQPEDHRLAGVGHQR